MADYKLPIITGTSLTTGDLLRWDGSNWVNYPDSNYENFVDRGDRVAADFDKTDLTFDGNWNDLNLGGIVPAGATLIYIRLEIEYTTLGSYVFFRKNGNANVQNIFGCRVQVSGIRNDAMVLVPCDSNRVIEYLTTDIDPATYTVVNIHVLGWWI